jgi:uncharacterized membrane protein YgcG
MKLITCASVILACSALVAACSNEQSDPQPSAPNAPAPSSVGSPSPSPAEGSGARAERSIAIVHGSGSVDKWVLQTTPNGQKVIALDRAKKELATWLLTRSPDGTPRLTSVGREVDPKLIAGFACDATANRHAGTPSVLPTTGMDEDSGDSGENSPGCAQATFAALIACIGVETGIGTAACLSALAAMQIACAPPPSCNPNSCNGPCIDAGYMMGGQCITPTGSCTCAGNYCRSNECDSDCRMSGHTSGTCYTSGCMCSGDDDGSSGGGSSGDPGSGSGSSSGSGSGSSDSGGCDSGSFPVSCNGEDAGCATTIEEALDMCP